MTEEVPEHLARILGSILDVRNEVFRVDVHICRGGRARLVRELFLSGIRLVLQEACIVCLSGLRCLLQCTFACDILLGYCLVGKVDYRIGSHREIWGAVNVPHGKIESKPHQLLVDGGFPSDKEGDGRVILHTYPQPHVRIG